MLPKDVHATLEHVRILDVREPHEYDAGHIDGSVHVPLMSLPKRASELDEDARWVVVCQIGQRSDMAARWLRVRGFDAHNLDGGLVAWLEAGLPLALEERAEVVDGYGKVLDWTSDPGS